jgi:eukaryotic-like serine/threonine-protein kinase
MARRSVSPEDERRALALFEHLADDPGNSKLRARLTRDESDAVLTRLRALEASVTRAAGAIPTLIPGSADCEGVLLPPERIGAFRLVERIGRGGMGDVWLGQRDDGLYDQKIAIKLIQRHALNRAARAFDDERRFLARLEHPNIARLIDGGVTEDGLPWLAMEYFDGHPIDRASEGLGDRACVGLFIKAADAVQHAHSRLIAHADLKPSNILVGPDGRVKLLDFGIAGLIGAGPRAGVGSGPLTRDFASPERIAGDGPSVADDVYGLGKTLSLILDGRDDQDLVAIAAKAKANDPAARYGSVAELIADLDRWRAHLPVTAMPDGAAYRVEKFFERHRLGVIATGVALLGLTTTTLIATSSYVRAERARSDASARFEDARGTARYVAINLLNDLAARPGTLALRGQAAGVAQHYLDRLAESPAAPEAMRIEAAEGLLRLAAAQGRPGVPNLDQPDAAVRNLAKASALAASVDSVAAWRLGVRIRLDQARLIAQSENRIPAALAILAEARKLLDRDPGAPTLLESQYFTERANALEWKGDYPAGIAAARRADALLPNAETRDILLQRATAQDLLAEGIYYSQPQKRAIAPYRYALALLERARVLYPADQIVARKLARARWALGTTLVDNGAPSEALALIEASSVGVRQVLAFDPADADAQRMLRISENARGQALAAVGRIEEGLTLFKANTAERKLLWQARPTDAMRLRDYMVAVKGLGDMQTQFGHTAEGCATYRDARQIIAQIGATGRLTGMDTASVVADLVQREKKFCTG